MAEERTELDIKLEIKKLQLELEEKRRATVAKEHKQLEGKWIRIAHGGWNTPLAETSKFLYMHVIEVEYATEVSSNVYLLSANGDIVIEVYKDNIVDVQKSDGMYKPERDFYTNRYDIMKPSDIKACLEEHKKESNKQFDKIISEIK